MCSVLCKKFQDFIGFGCKKNSCYIDGYVFMFVKNVIVWVGELKEGIDFEVVCNGKGYGWIYFDVYLEYGFIKKVEVVIGLFFVVFDIIVFDVCGWFLMVGIIDMYSYVGVGLLFSFWGNEDINEMLVNISFFVCFIDVFYLGDFQIQVIKFGGVIISFVLLGFGNNMGGEVYVIKYVVGKVDGRNEISVVDLLVDFDWNWRYMKMVCGENVK